MTQPNPAQPQPRDKEAKESRAVVAPEEKPKAIQTASTSASAVQPAAPPAQAEKATGQTEADGETAEAELEEMLVRDLTPGD
jgi:hypothetical protein